MGKPRCSSIARTPGAPFTYAKTRRLHPHLTQANTSKSNVLLLGGPPRTWPASRFITDILRGPCQRMTRTALSQQLRAHSFSWSAASTGSGEQPLNPFARMELKVTPLNILLDVIDGAGSEDA